MAALEAVKGILKPLLRAAEEHWKRNAFEAEPPIVHSNQRVELSPYGTLETGRDGPMRKLIVKQNTIDYYGFFVEPLFPLLGEVRTILSGLYRTFADYNVTLGSFRLEGEVPEPSTAAVAVMLGRFGNYRLRFDSVHVSLRSFSEEDLEGMVTVIQKGDSWLRATVPEVEYRTHAAVYNGHCSLRGTTSSEFLLGLPRRNIPVFGNDLGSGIVETWHDEVMDAKIRLTIDHSLQESDGVYINYMVTLERDKIDYVGVAQRSNELLESIVRGLGLDFGEEES